MSLRLSLIGLSALALAACGQGAPQPDASEAASAGQPTSDAVAVAPAELTAADLRRVCRAGLAAIHGQQVADVQIEGLDGRVVRASWRAPVDGGRMFAECRVEGDVISWRPTGLPDPAQERWMDTAEDPVVRYVLRGEEIEVNQTFPDGTSEQAMLAVRADEEAR
ncbi:hypothetical protein [Brevundimonas balnearis]|uniref:Lipoprotein n=1 Tax=Brevundimonas balnearis TaxID=1572858 RepID=A0ABV6R172_9CAUL